MELLLRERGRTVPRDALITQVWGVDFEGDERMIDRHVAALRRKLGTLGDKNSLGEFLKIGISTVVCALTALLLNHLIPEAASSLYAFLRLGAVAALSVIVYAGALLVTGVKSVNTVVSMVSKKLLKR